MVKSLDLENYKQDRQKQMQGNHLLEDEERKRQEARNSWFGFLTIAYWKASSIDLL